MKKTTIFLLLFLSCIALWAQNRFALVIGNANYPDPRDRLPNTINDTDDISAALKKLGYTDLVLKQNLKRLEMIREVNAFIAKLKSSRNTEGFFWYAGHAIEIGGENYLMPIDVTTDEGDEIIKETSYSVTNLARQLEGVGNKLNVVVLDACRIPPGSGGGRGAGDTSRTIKTIQHDKSDLLIMYSTASGTTASDGTGKRNSPFTEAFLKYINTTESLVVMAAHVQTETLSLTQQRQRPYTSGSLGSENIYYSLNPNASQPVQPGPPQNPSSANTARTHFERGELFSEREDWDTAIVEYTEAIRLDPNFKEAYYGRGNAYYEKKDYDRAIADCTQAIRIDPNYAHAYDIRGMAYCTKGDNVRGKADLETAYRIEPTLTRALMIKLFTY